MIYETLYKRAKSKKIQFWKINVVDNGDTCSIFKTTGQLNTDNPIIHPATISKGLQKRTILEQAHSVALSDWKRKRDEGNKSLEDLNIEQINEFYYVDGGKVAFTLEEALEEALSEFNSDANGNLIPMKAKSEKYIKGKKLNYPQYMEPKLDGFRAGLHIDRVAGKVISKFLSKSGKEYKALVHLTDEINKNYTGITPIILDGELYDHGLLLSQIATLVKSLKPETPRIKFHIFDMPLFPGKQSERTQEVHIVISRINSPLFPKLKAITIYSDDEIMPLHDSLVSEGYEGGMLKDPNGLYEPGTRTSNWCKVKEFDDDEYKIVGYSLGERGAQDLSFNCEILVDGLFKTFDAPMNGTIASKEELVSKIDSLIGKKLTVKHFGFTAYGIPFLPKGKAIREKE